jgi:hypothetical protein
MSGGDALARNVSSIEAPELKLLEDQKYLLWNTYRC